MTAVADRAVWTPPKRKPRPLVSAREIDVLLLLAAGSSTDEVGAGLFIAAETVKTHIKRMMRRTKTANRTALVAWAFRMGVLT